MKFREIFRFELAYQICRPWVWLILAVLLVISFMMARDSALVDALYEDFFANSPFAVAKTTVISGLFWLLVGAVIAGEAAARDVSTRMHPLTYTSPVSKTDYLGGRFLAAFTLNALLLFVVQVGILLGVYSPGVQAQAIGPFRLAAFLNAYAFIALPNAFAATAVQFFAAGRAGRAMAGYLGSMLLVFTGFFAATILNYFVKQGLGTLLDPIGVHFIIEDLAHLWTAIEKSWRVVALEGTVLKNRLLWLGVGLGTLTLTYVQFRFAHRTESTWWWRKRRGRHARSSPGAARGLTAIKPVVVPQVKRAFGFTIQARKTLAIAVTSFRTLATGWGGFVFFGVIPAMTVLVVLDQMGSMGTALVPKTARVLMELTGGLSAELAAEPNRWVIVPLFIVFFAGELVWREREAGLSEITDAMPGSEWASFLGKLLGLGFVLVVFMTLLTMAGMLAQVIMSHHDFEIGLYAKVLFGLQLPEYLLFAVIALVVHVVVNQKYVGHLMAILAYAFTAVLAKALGIEHNLLVYGTGPKWWYTEMSGFGASLGPWLWFKLYWAAWALILAMVAKLFWARGKEAGQKTRIQEARRRCTGSTLGVGATGAVFVLILGGFIFYNTNVLNDYISSSELNELSAEYERRYARFSGVPQPELTAANLHVEIYPERRAVDINGHYRLVNQSPLPIDSLHVTTGAANTRAVTLDRRATLAVDDVEHGYRIYALEKPLAPGDSLRLNFEVVHEPRGFSNRGSSRAIVSNGSFFNGQAWLPFVGYQRFRELMSPGDRRAHDLPPRPVLDSLYEVEGREPAMRGGGIAFEAVVGTDADQVAIAPGALRRTWTEDGRRYFQYSTDAPVGEEWGFFSAEYAVREGHWRPSAGSGHDVAIRIYHHPEHTGHLDRMLRSVVASLDYNTEQFGAYPYRHLTVVEHPGATGTGAHADPSMISHGQGFPHWIPEDDTRSLDMPFFVMAHEMAHQWTLPYALVEGLPFLAEGLANYSAMQVVKASQGDEQFRRLMRFMREPYPYRPIRRGEPLLRALDPYLARRRGPFAMYALSEYVGSDRVNGAIKRLIEKHDVAGGHLVTTLDLYRELQAVTPDSLQYLLHDLFEVNTYWDFETQRATAKEIADDTWQVSLEVRARKAVYDSAGVETEVPMDEWLPIGVFGSALPGRGALSAPLPVEKHRIRSGAQTITLTVPGRPVFAGVDPYHLLDWEDPERENNIEPVQSENSLPIP